MKISELIGKLEAIKTEHGDLDVKYANKENVQIGDMTWDTSVDHKDIVGVEAREVYGGKWEKIAGDPHGRRQQNVIGRFVELDEY